MTRCIVGAVLGVVVIYFTDVIVYGTNEAIAGVIAETIYLPASAFLLHWLLRTSAPEA